MKYFTINSLIESLKDHYPTLSRVALIFNVSSLRETMYKSKQGMPYLMKLFTAEGEQVLKFEDLINLFDDEDFYVSFRLPVSFKDPYVCVDIIATPISDERLITSYYQRSIRQLGPKTLKMSIEQFKKQKLHMSKDFIDGEPFEI